MVGFMGGSDFDPLEGSLFELVIYLKIWVVDSLKVDGSVSGGIDFVFIFHWRRARWLL